MMPMRGFVLEDVTVARGSVLLLDNACAHLPGGQCTALVGPSGAGKSTLLRVLNRLEEPSGGRVLLDGVPVTALDVLTLRRRVGLVGQRPVLLAGQVAEEIRVARPDLSDAAVAELVERVGLPAGFAQRATAGLSGGEAQRVCLARALAVEPEVLLLDEPTSALDGPNAAIVARLVRGHVDGGGSVVLTSHDQHLVRTVADSVLVLEGGRLAPAEPEQVVPQ
jgi:putative ABC transport system ATP-binding protein